MEQVLVEKPSLTAIANAIRGKNGSSDAYKPNEMPEAIANIPVLGTLVEKSVTANGTYYAQDDNADGYSKVTVDVVPTYGTKNITQNGEYLASADNYDGYSSVVVNIASVLAPFDTYEFNVPNDINWKDATGTSLRTLVNLDWHQAMLDKLAEYTSITVADHPFAIAGCAKILFSVVPKNPSAIIVPDSKYIKCVRKDSCYYVKIASGQPTRYSPLWRAQWRLKTNGAFEYAGSFNTSNDYPNFDIAFPASQNKLRVQTQFSQYNGQMISAGDYVVRLYDLTGVVL